jgi:Lon protease-like protein
MSLSGMDDQARVRSALRRLPIFPLPGAVLLPHALVPLHIFEPRYRKMTSDCDAGLRTLALAHIPDERAAGEQPPRVLPVVGVGVLARVDRLPDGRFNIVLRGVARASIQSELPQSEPYRLVRAQLLEARGPGANGAALADALRHLVLALSAARRTEETQSLAQLAARAQAPGDLADIVAGALLATPRERQAVLEAVELEPRLELATQAAAAALARTASSASAAN